MRTIWTIMAAIVIAGCTPEPEPKAEAAPPCKNGAAECKPWEREWEDERPPVGTVVADDGRVIQEPAEKAPD